MASTAFSNPWRPSLVAATPTGPRHRAPESADAVLRIVPAGPELHRTGRHAEPEWHREQFDPMRDEIDAFDWLGFAAAQD